MELPVAKSHHAAAKAKLKPKPKPQPKTAVSPTPFFAVHLPTEGPFATAVDRDGFRRFARGQKL